MVQIDFSFVFASLGIAFVVFYILQQWFNPAAPKPLLAESKSSRKQSLDDSKQTLNILYSTQTGTAENFASQISDDITSMKLDINIQLSSIEDFDYMSEFETMKHLIFVASTYGDGDPPDVTIDFNTWLLSDLSSTLMENCKYTVYGLGDSQYEHFCQNGKRIFQRLEDIGAQKFHDLGTGDESKDLEDNFEAWKEELLGVIPGLFGFEATDVASPSVDKFDAHYRIKWGDKEKYNGKNLQFRRPVSSDTYPNYTFLDIEMNYELRKNTKEGSTKHIKIATGDNLTYKTADNLGIYPKNDPKLVARLAERLGEKLDSVFTLAWLDPSKSMRKPFLPPQCCLEEALTWYCDITNSPRKKFLRLLGNYAKDDAEKAELLAISKDNDLFQKEVHDKGFNVCDLLEKYKSVEVPLEVFLEYGARLQPRFFTIASSNKAVPQSVELAVAILKDKLPDGEHVGICSNYLDRQVAGKNQLACFARDSTFRLPEDRSIPVIMIGPGTGLAPFRAFLQEAKCLNEEGAGINNWVLFFGCRYRDQDYIYKDELEEAKESGILSHLHLAFSREGKEKVYVQHLLKKESEFIYDLIENKGAYLYVCGALKMGQDIREQLGDLFTSKGKDGPEYLKTLTKANRFVQELWG